MRNTDDSWLNPTKRAKDYLNKALEGDIEAEDLVVLNEEVKKKEEERKKAAEEKARQAALEPAPVVEETHEDEVAVDEARFSEPVLMEVTDREKIRLLIVTKDVSILEENSISYQKIAGERTMFYELHIVILNVGGSKTDDPVIRLFENVWVYRTNSKLWWTLIYDGYKVAESQLVFSGGFRADIVVGDDLFEAGLVAWYVAKKHGRPFQLHIGEDFFDETFVEEHEHPMLYRLAVWYLIRHAGSVRTHTEFQRQSVIEERPDLEAVTEVLPTYYDLGVWRDLEPTVDLHVKYPQFKFIILHVSSMRPTSHALEALVGAAALLRRYPTLGLVMVGNGPLRADLERQAIALGVQNQVEFEPMRPEVISYMKTANVLIQLSEDASEESLVLEGAVSKVPLVANASGIAGKLFVDGESACLCAPSDIACVTNGLNRYLNENQERSSFAINASEIVFERIEQDYGAYLEAYRESVERAILPES
ncbi:MAG TPA: glycosyltransferase [Candidatus Paceibacterota bacterium]|nr:glycosyltransferase [Candidatus Paceibacterota bacterium]